MNIILAIIQMLKLHVFQRAGSTQTYAAKFRVLKEGRMWSQT